MLMEVARVDSLVLFVTLGESVQFIIIKHDVRYGFFIDASCQIEKVPFYSYFVEALKKKIMKGCWILSCVFCTYGGDRVDFVFYSIDMVYSINRLSGATSTLWLNVSFANRYVWKWN